VPLVPVHVQPCEVLHLSPGAQGRSQKAQLVVVLRLVQVPLQQPCPDAHLLLQEPQLETSVLRLTQVLPQTACSGGQTTIVVVHTPFTQLCPGGHWEFFVQVVHTPLTQAFPDGHCTLAVHAPHEPPTQTCPVAQGLPQEPQLETSVLRSVQVLPQAVCPGGQLVTQVPF
jgi:hypothetical protein